MNYMDYFYDYFMVLLWCLRFPLVFVKGKIPRRNIMTVSKQ